MRRIRYGFMLCALLLTGCSQTAKEPVQPDSARSADVFAMDTYMNLKVWCNDGGVMLEEAVERIEQLESTFSVTVNTSDISRINAAGGAPVQVSDDTACVIGKALEIGEISGGALDISVYPVLRAWGFTTEEMHIPSEEELAALLPRVDFRSIRLDGNTVTVPEDMCIDLGALAKGYTSDAVMEIFRENGAESAIISLGGNVQALGTKPDGSLWKVGIVNPFSPAENMCTVEIADQAVITSGNYERYFVGDDGQTYWHIIDKTDGYPADNGLVSVTVIGDSGLECDALSTALFVEGTEQAQAHWQSAQDFEMILVTDDGRILYTEGLEGNFRNVSPLPAEVITYE